MIPVRIIMQKFDTFRIAFHGIDQAFQQVMFILFCIEFAAFISELLAKAFQYVPVFVRSVPWFSPGVPATAQIRFSCFQFLLSLHSSSFPVVSSWLFADGAFFFQLLDASLQVLNRSIGNSTFFSASN